jgi:hypothetical protein
VDEILGGPKRIVKGTPLFAIFASFAVKSSHRKMRKERKEKQCISPLKSSGNRLEFSAEADS